MTTLPLNYDSVKIEFSDPSAAASEEILVLFLGEMAGDDKSPQAPDNQAYADAVKSSLSASLGKAAALVNHVHHAIKHARFKGKFGDGLKIFAPPSENAKLARILVMGYGKKASDAKKTDQNAPHLAANDQKTLTPAKLADLGAAIIASLSNVTQKSARVLVAGLDPILTEAKISATEAAAQMALGAKLRAWRFDPYLTKQKPEDKPSLTHLNFMLDDAKQAAAIFAADHNGVADAIGVARYLVAEPANALTPPIYADHLQAIKIDGLTIAVFDEKKLAALKMGAMLGVAQG
ncbi:MAG: hypothetical protein ORN98_07320, partial [Alphaproteobacteria bacterium]|nr:hypothetical protein [Alphaproteobacteria bacterium]